jgi:hypothetical protein
MASMSQSGVCTFPSASPSTVTVIQAEWPRDHQHARSSSNAEAQCCTTVFQPSGVREISRQQWEGLKPLIQRVYIDENKPFPYLADILRKDHGFEPT